MLWVVRKAQELLISRVSLMVGRLAGKLFTCGGLMVTGTTPTEGTQRGEEGRGERGGGRGEGGREEGGVEREEEERRGELS